MEATIVEQDRRKKEHLQQLAEAAMNFQPRHFTGKDSQEDIRKIARQEMIKLLREYGLIT